MMKFQTSVDCPESRVRIGMDNRVLILGSCFADNIGSVMRDHGFNVLINPFGTLYNPISVRQALERLESAEPFTAADCVEMGAGAGLICSFSHHTAAARPTAEAFLADANASLEESVDFWKQCDRVIVTFGTAWCWKHLESGRVVANCLKRPTGEFSREMLSPAEAAGSVSYILRLCGDRKSILTVSPVRHLGERGAHANLLSKSTLVLAIDEALTSVEPSSADYFPSYEIMMDELRDYRFYAEDMVHPSPLAVKYIWEKFCEAAVPAEESEKMREAEKASRRARHRGILFVE